MTVSRKIETPRLVIAPFSDCYLTERYVSWLNDPEIVRYSEQRFKTHTKDSCREYLHAFENSPDYFWAITVKGGEEGHIGNMTASVMPEYGTADLSILIGERECWGKGYATEAWTAVCDFLFATGFRKITAGTLSINKPMRRLIERTGMIDDGLRVGQAVYQGKAVDIVYAALFIEKWNPGEDKHSSIKNTPRGK